MTSAGGVVGIGVVTGGSVGVVAVDGTVDAVEAGSGTEDTGGVVSDVGVGVDVAGDMLDEDGVTEEAGLVQPVAISTMIESKTSKDNTLMYLAFICFIQALFSLTDSTAIPIYCQLRRR